MQILTINSVCDCADGMQQVNQSMLPPALASEKDWQLTSGQANSVTLGKCCQQLPHVHAWQQTGSRMTWIHHVNSSSKLLDIGLTAPGIKHRSCNLADCCNYGMQHYLIKLAQTVQNFINKHFWCSTV